MDSQSWLDLAPWVIAITWPLLWLAETVSPIVAPASGARLKHVGRNIGVMVAGFAINFLYGPTLVALCGWTEAHRVGLLNLVALPGWVELAIGVLVLDVADYWRHRAHHAWRPMWRLHQVHHLDERPDASTGLLNHPFEVFTSVPFYAVAIVAVGVSPVALALRIAVGMGLLLFHHSNLALPPALDAALSLVTPTPRSHRVHHARRMPLTDSNFGTCFTWWDRMFGTFRTVPDIAALETGLDDYPRQTAGAMLVHPFRRESGLRRG